MRRYVRTLVGIGVLLTLALLALAINPIRIGDFERGGGTALGLKLGLDLQGGSHLEYEAALVDPETGESLEPTKDQMNALKTTIEERVNASGLGKPIIQLLGNDRLLIQLPGTRDTARAKRLIGETARLEIKHRILNISRAIPGISSEDIISVQVATIVEATSTPAALGLATAAVEAAESEATSTEPSLGTQAQFESGVPSLVVEFTEEAAERFAEAVDRLRESLVRTPGADTTYPSFLTLSEASDAAPPIQIPYFPFAMTTAGEAVPLGDAPLVQRFEDSNRFSINLGGSITEIEEAQARFGGEEPELILGETLGKLDEDIGLTGEDLAKAYAGQHQGTGLPIVNLEFNSEGARKFGEITTLISGTGDQTVFILDDTELMSPISQRPITGGAAYIESRAFNFDRVMELALLLESGRLPIPIELVKERGVDAILGADSLAKSVRAGLAGLALVLVFMVLYYRMAGVVAAAALMIYAVLILAIFKMVPITLELPNVAAGILSIGMAVDANILIFERMKEELRAGRTLLSSVNLGFDRAWPAIRDSNVSTLITCAILFWFADTLRATLVQDFAFTLAIGVGMSMFTAITVSRTLLRMMTATPLGKRPGAFVPFPAAELPQPRALADEATRS